MLLFTTLSMNGTQHNSIYIILSRNAERRVFFTVMLSAIMLSVVMLNVIILSVIFLIAVAPTLWSLGKKKFHKNIFERQHKLLF